MRLVKRILIAIVKATVLFVAAGLVARSFFWELLEPHIGDRPLWQIALIGLGSVYTIIAFFSWTGYRNVVIYEDDY